MVARFIKSPLAAAVVMLTPVAAFAHTGLGHTASFQYGLAHPISGLDHILAMVLIGVLAWRAGGRALWLIPAAFVSVMAAGGMLGMSGITVPFIETGIALSVVLLGAAVAFDVRPHIVAAIGAAALFAIFHGQAHGAEMPADLGGAAYAAGFLIATALLHLTGIGAAAVIDRAGQGRGDFAVRMGGAAASLSGVGFLTGVL